MQPAACANIDVHSYHWTSARISDSCWFCFLLGLRTCKMTPRHSATLGRNSATPQANIGRGGVAVVTGVVRVSCRVQAKPNKLDVAVIRMEALQLVHREALGLEIWGVKVALADLKVSVLTSMFSASYLHVWLRFSFFLSCVLCCHDQSGVRQQGDHRSSWCSSSKRCAS